jgi:tRNA (uracil-5-)-methyltransferase
MPLPPIDPALYDAQLADKVAGFRTFFAPFGAPEPQVFASAPLYYRLRAEFRVWQQGDSFEYAMFDPDNPKQPVLMRDFPAASASICAAMHELHGHVLADATLKQQLYSVEFLATLAGDLLITLIYHKQLDEAWEVAARALMAAMGVAVMGRSRGQKLVPERDWVEECIEVDGRALRYRQYEGAFSQPNGGVNRQMLGWACAQASALGHEEAGDLLELYCGNGNFTMALAPHFGRVLATEMSKTSVQAALHNQQANGVDNLVLARMSSEEMSAALSGETFQRLRDIDLASYRFRTLFVDPPRSGLDPATLAIAASFAHILYISCSQQTLRDNVDALQATHTIAAAAIFDQFPYTHHLECGLHLIRR